MFWWLLLFLQQVPNLYGRTSSTTQSSENDSEEKINQLLVSAVAIVLEDKGEKDMARSLKEIQQFKTSIVKSELNSKLKLGITFDDDGNTFKARIVDKNSNPYNLYERNKELAENTIKLINEIAHYQNSKDKKFEEIKAALKSKLINDHNIATTKLESEKLWKSHSETSNRPDELTDYKTQLVNCNTKLIEIKRELEELKKGKPSINTKFSPLELLKQFSWYYWLAIPFLLVVGVISGFLLRGLIKKTKPDACNKLVLLQEAHNKLEIKSKELENTVKEKQSQIDDLKERLQNQGHKNPDPNIPTGNSTTPIGQQTKYFAYLYSDTFGFYQENEPSKLSMFEITVLDSKSNKGDITLKVDLSADTINYIVKTYYVYEYAFAFKKPPFSGETNIKVLKSGKVFWDSSTGYWKIEGNNKIEVEFY